MTDRFQLAGVPVRVESGDGEWLRLLERRLARFRSSKEPRFTIRQETVGSRPRGVVSPFAVYREAHEAIEVDGGFRITTPSASIEVDLVDREASIRGPRALYPFDLLVSYLLPIILDRGVLFHAAALAADGRGWIAAGPSGSGKSTLARIAGEAALCDESVAVRLEAGAPKLIATPYWRARPGEAELAGIFLLQHGEETKRRRLPAGEAVARISRQVQWPVCSRRRMRGAFDDVVSVVERVPVWDLTFRPHAETWDLIRKEP